MSEGLPKAIAVGILKIGDRQLPCAVLDDADNTRVFTQEGFLTAIGRAGKAKGGEGATVDGLPAFLRANNLKPFVSQELIESTTPIIFEPYKGSGYKGTAFGYKATLLPKKSGSHLTGPRPLPSLSAGSLTISAHRPGSFR